jgi:hypothetical protein
MPNGTHALAALALDPPAPARAAAPVEVERQIGEAAASAAMAISMGLADLVDNGQLGTGTKQMGGKTLTNVCILALEHFGEFDFDLVARRAGNAELNRRHRAMLLEHMSAAKVDAAFDDLLGHVLVLASQVVAEERARAH